MTRIGIVDLQGGVVEHLVHLERLHVPAVRVKQAADMDEVCGLIIPGGESSCLGRLLRLYGLDRAIRARFEAGLRLWGTCAGAILMAGEVDGETGHLGLMDIHVRRNAFGGQLDSFNTLAEVPAVSPHPIPLTFIRAPKIIYLGEGVRPLLMLDDKAGDGHRAGGGACPAKDGEDFERNLPSSPRRYCAAAEDERSLVTVFHPELTPDPAFHRYFCHKCGIETGGAAMPGWQQDSWTHLAPITRL